MLKLEEIKEIYEVPSIGFNDSHYLANFTERDIEKKEISLKEMVIRFRVITDLLDQIRLFEYVGKVEITRYILVEYNENGLYEVCEILGWNYKVLN